MFLSRSKQFLDLRFWFSPCRLILILWIGVLFLLAINQVWAADPASVFAKTCASCHGDKGNGEGRAGIKFNPPATNFTDPKWALANKPDQMAVVIKNGKNNTAMVGYGKRFNDAEIKALVDYIIEHFVKQPKLARASATILSTNDTEHPGLNIYTKHCSACHGDRGSSAVWAQSGLNPPPRNFTSAESRRDLSLERMITSVTHGRPGTAMMPFSSRLSKSEIAQVVDYIRSHFMQAQSSSNELFKQQSQATSVVQASAVDMAKLFDNGLRGNSQRGRDFFMNNCYVCHGKQGDGKGPRAHFNRPAPRDFTSHASRQELNRPRLFHAIANGKKGSVMSAWKTVLSDQQIADVSEFVFQAFVLAEKKSQ
ncbi:MAG: c-type cytochrome [Gammaproteobacteria bacterium]|nr:c-type cytochrome [Gammaproteobacteria bacterium]